MVATRRVDNLDRSWSARRVGVAHERELITMETLDAIEGGIQPAHAGQEDLAPQRAP